MQRIGHANDDAFWATLDSTPTHKAPPTPDAVALWFQYVPRYHEIQELCQRNPHAAAAMKHDPGMKFMRKGYAILAGIIFLLMFIGAC